VSDAALPRSVAIVGAGEIGSGWAALFAAHGCEVQLFDADPTAERRVLDALACARRLQPVDRPPGRVTMHTRLVAALDGAEWVQESLPEQPALKRTMLTVIDTGASRSAIIASSTSTRTVPELVAGLACGERTIIAHPLHPVYAVPVVELVGGPLTSPATMRRAEEVLRALGRDPVVVRGELRGLVSNRLTAALLREAFDLVARGVIDAADLDRLVARGIALGWVTAGPLRTEAIAAGPKGFTGFLDALSEPLSDLWRSLASWEELDPPQRYALERSMEDRGAADDVAALPPGHCTWAEWLARVEREARRGEPGSP
jgi:3-hydroxyacyl-CoA dehydrogenase